MSKHQSDRKEDIQSAGQTDRVTERQNGSMSDSRAAKEPALVSHIRTENSILLHLKSGCIDNDLHPPCKLLGQHLVPYVPEKI